MSDMKCPFCQQELVGYVDVDNRDKILFYCNKCNSDIVGSAELWQELIRTRKALEIAVDALDAGRTLARIAGFEMLATGMDEALNKIKALEQKDVK